MSVREMIKQYEEMRSKFIHGTISLKEWTDYCTDALGELINANIEILERLGNY